MLYRCLPVLLLLVAKAPVPTDTSELAQRIGSLPAALAKSKLTDAEIVVILFTETVGRPPTDVQKERSLEFFKKQGAGREKVCQDLVWVLTNLQEFARLYKLDEKPDEHKRFVERLIKVMEGK